MKLLHLLREFGPLLITNAAALWAGYCYGRYVELGRRLKALREQERELERVLAKQTRRQGSTQEIS